MESDGLDLSGLGSAQAPIEDVPVENLEFSYIASCQDKKEMQLIVETLKSGKLGMFPELQKAAEDKLLELYTPDERSKYIAMNHGPSWTEQKEASNEVNSWLKTAAKITAPHGPRATHVVPPARGQRAQPGALVPAVSLPAAVPTTGAAGNAFAGGSRASAKLDTKAEPFSQFYKRWDAVDVNAELDRVDKESAEDERVRVEAASKAQTAAALARAKRLEELKSLKLGADVDSMSAPDRERAAAREKSKGNESFKAKEFEEAVLFYSRALAYEGSSSPAASILFANRAQGHLKLKQWASAESDGSSALTIDPSNIKAWVRRGTARLRRGNAAQAVSDLQKALELAPSDSGASEVRRLLLEAEGKVKGEDAAAGLSATDATPAQKDVKMVHVEGVGMVPGHMIESVDPWAKKPGSRRLKVEEADAPSPPPTAAPKRVRVTVVDEEEEEDKQSLPAPAPAPRARPLIVETESAEPAPALPVPAPVPTTTMKQPVPALPHAAAVQSKLHSKSDIDAAEQEKNAGNEHFKASKFTEAVDAYTRSLELRPRHAAVLANRAQARLQLEQFKSAAVDCDMALTASGISSSTLAELAAVGTKAGLSSGRSAAAVDAASSEAGSDLPIVIKALYRRSKALRAQGKLAAAVADLAAGSVLEPTNVKVAAELAETRALLASQTHGAVPASPSQVMSPLVSTVSSPSPAKVVPVVRATPASPPSAAASPVNASPKGPASLAAAAAASARATTLPLMVLPSSPTTMLELEQGLTSLRRNANNLATYVRSLDGRIVSSLGVKRTMEPETAGAVLRCMARMAVKFTLPEDGLWIADMLEGLSLTSRWGTTALMMGDEEAGAVAELIKSAASLGVTKARLDKVHAAIRI